MLLNPIVIFAFFVVAVPTALLITRYRKTHQNRQLRSSGTKNKSTKVKHDRERINLRYADDQIFISGQSVFTGVRMGGTTDEFLTEAEGEEAAERIANTYADLIAVFDGKSVECQEIVRYRPASTEQWASEYVDHLWNPTKLFKQLLRQVRSLLSMASPERQRFLIVKLGEFTGRSFPDPLTAAAEKITGVPDEHFEQKDLDPFYRRAVKVHLQLARHKATPMTKADLVWLCRKTVSGHRQPSDMPVLASRGADGSTQAVRASQFDMLFDFRGRNGHDYIEILDRDPETGEERSSYTTTLVVSTAPNFIDYNPATAWGPRLASLSRPVELNWRYELIPAEEYKKRVKDVITNIKDESTDRVRGGAQHEHVFAAKQDRAEQIEEEVQLHPQPAMIGRLRLILSAPTPRDLIDAEQEVRSVMGDTEMVRVARSQYHLLKEQLPGEYNGKIIGGLGMAKSGIKIGERYTDVWAGAIARLDSDDHVGDEQDYHKGQARGWRGFPIGYNHHNGNPVHFQLHVQVARDKGAGVGLIGGTGGGKTTTALLLFFWESEAGTQCVGVDPKNEFERFCYYISFGPQCLEPAFRAEADENTLGTPNSHFQPINREFWNNTTIVNLTRGKAGLLDPWVVKQAYGSYNADVGRTEDPYAAAEALARGQLELMINNAPALEMCVEALSDMRREWEALKEYEANPATAPKVEAFEPSLGRLEKYLIKYVDRRAAINEAKGTPESDAYLRSAQRVLDEFRNARNVRYARLMYGTGATEQELGDLRRRRVVFTMHGFVPPVDPEDVSKWSSEERNAAAVMYTVLDVMQGLFDSTERPHPVTGQLRTPPRALFIDEGYMITAIPAGRDLIMRGLRQGRSLNLVIVFISQQPSDVQKIEAQAKSTRQTEQNQFGTVVIFKQKSPGEAMEALQLLRDTSKNADDHSELLDLARNLLEEGPSGGLLRTGRCAVRDPSGRVATVDIDQMFWELVNATETNPDKRSDAQEEALSDDGREWRIDDRTLLDVRTAVVEDNHYDPLETDDDSLDYPAEFEEILSAPASVSMEKA